MQRYINKKPRGKLKWNKKNNSYNQKEAKGWGTEAQNTGGNKQKNIRYRYNFNQMNNDIVYKWSKYSNLKAGAVSV